MPWSGVELAEVAPPGASGGQGPVCVVKCGDYVAAFHSGGSVPSGALLSSDSFTVMHVPTQTARAYTGASTRGYSWGAGVAIGSYIYVRAVDSYGSNRDFRLIDPVTGGVSTLNSTGASSAPYGVLAAGRAAYVYAGSNQLHAYTTSGTLSTMTGGWSAGTAIAYNDGVIYVGGDNRVWEVDATTLTALGDYPVASPAGVGVVIGNRIHWASGISVMWYDMDTHDYATYAGASGEVLTGSLQLHSDGWLYATSTNGMSAINPTTGARAVDTLPTSLGRAGGLVSAGGYLWRPYGEPVS